ncbi:MAG: hypothetical protein JWL81_673 [Verrucomicrobiales bacterium]|nr:hypothetical protein [Verrucomicrobiales bacterium]
MKPTPATLLALALGLAILPSGQAAVRPRIGTADISAALDPTANDRPDSRALPGGGPQASDDAMQEMATKKKKKKKKKKAVSKAS